jgi:hypothetical protein
LSQQINLLAHEERPPILSGLRVLIGAAVLIPPILAYGAYVWVASSRLASTVARNDAAIAAERTTMNSLTQQINNRPVPVNLSTEIDALKPLAGQSLEVLNLLRQNAGKSNEGYAVYLALLARVTEDGLWLTSVKISNSGRSVSLAGNSMRKEAVLRYVQRLNEQFAPHGVRFGALELTPEPVKEGTTAVQSPVVAFKLN